MQKKAFTYSHSLLLPLTRSCGSHCRYCTYKQNDGRLLTFDEIENYLQKHSASGICEVVVTAGQSLEKIPEITDRWNKMGYTAFAEYVRDICHLILEHDLLPSLDIGPLSAAQLEMLAPYTASMTVMLENINRDFMMSLQEDKSIDDKLECISDAGLSRIPITTGLLLGVGESVDDGFATLNAIEELHEKYGHIQSVVFQPAISDGRFVTAEINDDEMQLLINYSKKIMPDVAVSIPLQAAWKWQDTGIAGIDDLGHLFEGTDGLDWEKPFPKLTEVERMAGKKGYELKARFPVFESMFRRVRVSEKMQSVIAQWTDKKEYMAYRN